MTEFQPSSDDMFSSGAARMRRLFPPIYIVMLGVINALLSLFFAILVAGGDPADFTVEARESGDRIAYFIAIFGLAFFVACMGSAAVWSANRPWARHTILVLTIAGTISISVALWGISFLASCAPIMLIPLVIGDVVLVRITYARFPMHKPQRA